jgi:hypothetical protein
LKRSHARKSARLRDNGRWVNSSFGAKLPIPRHKQTLSPIFTPQLGFVHDGIYEKRMTNQS